MGQYDIKSFNNNIQELIVKNNIDINKNGKIDNGEELANLLSTSGKNDINELFDYEVNTESNSFLKQYILGKAAQEGVVVPEGFKIKISNYDGSEYRDILQGNALKGIAGIETQKYFEDAKNWITRNSDKNKTIKDYCKEKGLSAEETKKVIEYYRFHEVRVEIFGARIKDMFNLLSQSKNDVQKKVSAMKISEEDKNKILEVKDFLDRYYKIEAEYNGRTINLMNLSDNDKVELAKNSPEFAKFLEKLQPELIKHTTHFSQKEMQGQELSDAGSTSRGMAYGLLGLLSFGLWKGFKEGKEMKAGMKGAERFAQFIKQNPEKGHAILNKCTQKLNDLSKNGTVYEEILEDGKKVQYQKGTELIRRYMKKIGFEGGEFLVEQKALHSRGVKAWINPLTKFKNARGAALASLILGTVMLSADDVAGAGKDYFQDQNNFGTATALKYAGAGVVGGIVSSAVFVPTFQNIVDYKRADGILKKTGILPKLKGLASLKHKGKWGIIGALTGVVLASTSSGSSWTSMGLTAYKMKKNGNDLENQGIISGEDNTWKNTYDNMMEYEAYKGKKEGITYGPTGDWTIGSICGGLGAFTAVNPVVQNTFTTLQGCSETLTASFYQVGADTYRNYKLDKEKEELVASVSQKI